MVDSDRFMIQKAPDIQRRIDDFNKKIIYYTILVYIPFFIVVFYEVFINPPQTVLTPISVMICTIILVTIAEHLKKTKPSFKEYLLYYFWRGKFYLNKYQNEGADKKDLKKSISFFVKLYNSINQRYMKGGVSYFETEKKINKSMIFLKYWIKNFVLKNLKKSKGGIYKSVENIFNSTYLNLIDEDFDVLSRYLKSKTVKYEQKSEFLIINLIYSIHSSFLLCLLFYGSVILILILTTIYFIFTNYGMETLFGVFTVISGVLIVLGWIYSIVKGKFESKN